MIRRLFVVILFAFASTLSLACDSSDPRPPTDGARGRVAEKRAPEALEETAAPAEMAEMAEMAGVAARAESGAGPAPKRFAETGSWRKARPATRAIETVIRSRIVVGPTARYLAVATASSTKEKNVSPA